MKFIPTKPDELQDVLIMLKQGAEKLKTKGIHQWQEWHNPEENQIERIKAGIDNGEFFFVEENETRIAMFRLMENDEAYWGKQTDEARYIHSLVVDNNYKGKNIGAVIIKNIIENLKTKGITILRLDCVSHNPFLCNYYESQGFVKVGTAKTAHSEHTFNLYEIRFM